MQVDPVQTQSIPTFPPSSNDNPPLGTPSAPPFPHSISQPVLGSASLYGTVNPHDLNIKTTTNGQQSPQHLHRLSIQTPMALVLSRLNPALLGRRTGSALNGNAELTTPPAALIGRGTMSLPTSPIMRGMQWEPISAGAIGGNGNGPSSANDGSFVPMREATPQPSDSNAPGHNGQFGQASSPFSIGNVGNGVHSHTIAMSQMDVPSMDLDLDEQSHQGGQGEANSGHQIQALGVDELASGSTQHFNHQVQQHQTQQQQPSLNAPEHTDRIDDQALDVDMEFPLDLGPERGYFQDEPTPNGNASAQARHATLLDGHLHQHQHQQEHEHAQYMQDDLDLDSPGDAAESGPGGRKKRQQVRVACTHCQKACKKCSNTRPCERCVKYGFTDCVDSSRKPRKTGVKRGPYKRRNSRFPGSSPRTHHSALLDSLHRPNAYSQNERDDESYQYYSPYHSPMSSTFPLHNHYPQNPLGREYEPYRQYERFASGGMEVSSNAYGYGSLQPSFAPLQSHSHSHHPHSDPGFQAYRAPHAFPEGFRHHEHLSSHTPPPISGAAPGGQSHIESALAALHAGVGDRWIDGQRVGTSGSSGGDMGDTGPGTGTGTVSPADVDQTQLHGTYGFSVSGSQTPSVNNGNGATSLVGGGDMSGGVPFPLGLDLSRISGRSSNPNNVFRSLHGAGLIGPGMPFDPFSRAVSPIRSNPNPGNPGNPSFQPGIPNHNHNHNHAHNHTQNTIHHASPLEATPTNASGLTPRPNLATVGSPPTSFNPSTATDKVFRRIHRPSLRTLMSPGVSREPSPVGTPISSNTSGLPTFFAEQISAMSPMAGISMGVDGSGNANGNGNAMRVNGINTGLAMRANGMRMSGTESPTLFAGEESEEGFMGIGDGLGGGSNEGRGAADGVKAGDAGGIGFWD